MSNRPPMVSAERGHGMIDRIAVAFTRPRLMQTTVDELIVWGCLFVAALALYGVGLIGARLYVMGGDLYRAWRGE